MSYDQYNKYEYLEQEYPEQFEYVEQEQDEYEYEYTTQEYPEQYIQQQAQVPVISELQDSSITFSREDQHLCNDCAKNSTKDPYYPNLSLATDPSWIIMTHCDTIFLQCSHMI